jgi:spoIIIJ-associated protein
MDQTQLDTIAQITQDLLLHMNISGTVAVSAEPSSETNEVSPTVKVQIESEEAGILIGFHGKNLESLQIMLGQITFKKTGTWVRLLVSVGDYLARREEQLREIALSTAAKVMETSQPQPIADLSASERRIVHMALQDNPNVMSESEGEGRDRRLVVKLRS